MNLLISFVIGKTLPEKSLIQNENNSSDLKEKLLSARPEILHEFGTLLLNLASGQNTEAESLDSVLSKLDQIKVRHNCFFFSVVSLFNVFH